MLIDFQQALAEITASPALCLAVRRDPALLEQRYRLKARERSQVVGVANHPSMECTCSLYRANRLAPLARNLPTTLADLADPLTPLLTQYWDAHPWPLRYGALESERFCRWLEQQEDQLGLSAAVRQGWRLEQGALRERMRAFLEASGLAIPHAGVALGGTR